jgi:CheY-like chemotaxis protein
LDAQPGEHVLLVISDTGVGMSEEVKAHLFEPFFTTKELGKGTGLGLATVYGIVTQSGGHIWAYSEEGQGSTFKVYLPRVEKIAQVTPRPRDLIDVPSGDETILLVEDDENVRDLARNVLQSHGYTILEARNGQEALLVSKHHPGPMHLLLTDVVMPGISGEQLAKLLTQARPDLKTLFMSGYTNNSIMQRGVLEPGIAFLQKPFSPTDLAGQVRQVLDTPQQPSG